VDAYLGPVLSRYLGELGEAAAAAGLPEPLVMRSSGGVASLGEASAHPVVAVLSGPAGGAVGAAAVARAAGFEDALALDMGGTSTDVSLVLGGAVARTAERAVGGLPIRLPSLDVHTVGAGGGSLVWRDAGGELRIGPQSAGAHPGPACYGRGGTEPTVSDANLVLGRLPQLLAGGVTLDRAAGEAALGDLDAADVVRAVDAELVRALRFMSVERGHDPRELALVAFGGAGPLHACAVAEELGIGTVLVPAAAGVLAALGLVVGERRRDRVRSYVQPLHEVRELPGGEGDLRYTGQSFELTVPLGGGADELAERFHRAHEERYGHADREREVELVAVRTADVEPAPPLNLSRHAGVADPRPVTGPAVLELDGATAWIAPGWVGVRDGSTWVVTRA